MASLIYRAATIFPLGHPILARLHLATGSILPKKKQRALLIRPKLRESGGAKKSDPNRSAAEGGNIGAYNDFFFEWGDTAFKIDGKYRTSIIIEPPNGQLPGLTDLGKNRWQTATKYE